MKGRLLKIVGMAAITLGVLQCLFHVFNHFFVDYYVAVGIREWGSSFALSVLLVYSGILTLKNRGDGICLMKGYLFATLLDRLIVLFLYAEYLHPITLFLPIVFAFPLGIILFFPRYSKYFKQDLILKKKILFSILFVSLILLPKVLF
jgi:hypothetical protein